MKNNNYILLVKLLVDLYYFFKKIKGYVKYIAGRNVNWYNYSGKQFIIFLNF